MKLNKVFILLPIVLLVLAFILLFTGKIETILFSSFLYGFIISTLSFILGLFSIQFGLEKSDRIFLVVVFGGLVIRLFLILMLIIITINFLFVSLNWFILITFIFYFYYMIIEIYILLQKKNTGSKKNNND